MKKKILIGSIIAVVILVLVSFTGVVGYQTTKSSTIARASPLFTVRTQRAIDKEEKDLTCDYVGKGEESVLSIPKRDDRAILTQKVIDRIHKMGDITFDRFIAYIIDSARKDNRLIGINPDRIRETLYLLRNSNNPIPILDTDTDYQRHTWFCGCPTCSCITFGHGDAKFLFCILLLLSPILVPLFIIIYAIIRLIQILFYPQ